MSGLTRRVVHLPSLLSASIDLAQRAGVIIKSIFESGNLHAVDKAAPHSYGNTNTKSLQSELNDPQTLADLSSQSLIIQSLSRAFPSLTLIGEEGDTESIAKKLNIDSVAPSLSLVDHLAFPEELKNIPIEDVVVWVDPLDGTKEYTLGHLDGVTVLIGVSIKGRAIAGVIGQPFTNHLVYGAVGVGTFGIKRHAPQAHSVPQQPEPAKVQYSNYPSPTAVKPAKRSIVTTRSHFTPLLSQLVNSIKPTEILRSGGAGSKSLMLLSRTTDCYYFPSVGLKSWDCVACDACITAAGGKCTDAYGRQLDYAVNDTTVSAGYQNERGMIATMSAADHDYYTLPESIDIQAKM